MTILLLIIFSPNFLLAGTIVKYKCPDGSIHVSDTGLPQELKAKGCKSDWYMEENPQRLKEAELADKKRYCQARCSKMYGIALQAEKNAIQNKDSLELERWQNRRKWTMSDCEADCIDGKRPALEKTSGLEEKTSDLEKEVSSTKKEKSEK